MSFGVGYGDIVTAFRQGKQVWDSFYDDFENAPKQILELRDIATSLRDSVVSWQDLVAGWGQELPGLEAIKKKLDEADEFVKKYSDLVPAQPGIFALDGKSRVKRFFKTWRHAFDERARHIKEGMQLQLQMLHDKVFLIAFQNAQNRVPGSTYGYPSRNDALYDASLLLQRAREERKRIDFEARRLRIEPDYTHSEQLVLQAEDILRGHIRLPQTENFRSLPIDQGAPGLLPSNFLHGIALNQGNTLHASVRSRSWEPQVWTLPSTPERRHVSPSTYTTSEDSTPATRTNSTVASTIRMTPSTMFTTPLPPAPSIKAQDADTVPPWLGEPSLPTHRATFAPKASNKRFKLDSYRFIEIPNSSRGRYLEWRGENPAHAIRHVIPTHPHETFPYTKHSTFKESRRVTFRAKHMCTVTDNQERIMHNRFEVEYRFTDDGYLKKFQSDARDKDLEGTFEADTIKTRHSRHQNEQVKIWRSRELDQTASLTFFCSGDDPLRHVELALKWFQSPIKKDESKRTVVLEPTKPPPEAAPDKKKGIFRRKSSATQTTGDSGPYSGDPTSPTRSQRGSVATIDSITSSFADAELPQHCPQELYDSIRSLTITFSTDKDFKAFNDTFDSAQNPSGAASRPATVLSILGGGSRNSPIFKPISELGDPAMIGAPAATTQGSYTQPHGNAQELAASTPASHLFSSSSAGVVQHTTGYQQLYPSQQRLTPPSPSTIQPPLQMLPHAQGHATAEPGYGVPDPAPGSAELEAERPPAELHAQTRTERFELDAPTTSASSSKAHARAMPIRPPRGGDG